MLTYKTLKGKAKDFLAATGLKLDEFANLLPAFEAAYVALYPTDQTAEGKARHRQPGGGTKGTLQMFEDKFSSSKFTPLANAAGGVIVKALVPRRPCRQYQR
jgi:hypothetical protein